MGVHAGQDLFGWEPRPFDDIDSTFAVQEHLQDTIRRDPENVEAILAMPDGQDELLWQYEHIRCVSDPARVGRHERRLTDSKQRSCSGDGTARTRPQAVCA